MVDQVDTRARLADAALLEAWRGGDGQAGRSLFQRYFERLLRFFWNKVDDEETAQDLVQETFLACVEGRDRLRDDASFASYLFRVARNRLASYWSARAARPLQTAVSSIVDAGGSPSSVVARGQNHARLLVALRRLPIDDQVLLELSYWEELSSAEIADVLEIPRGTVRWKLREARRSLQVSLERASRPGEGPHPSVPDETVDGWLAKVRDYLFHDRGFVPPNST